MSKQIQKVIRQKSQQVAERNIGFGFIYFAEDHDQLLKRMFLRNFARMTREG